MDSGEFYRRARVFIVQDRAYVVCAMSFEPDDPRALHFLDSFDLGIRPGAKEIRDPSPAVIRVPVEPPVTAGTPNVSINANAGEGVGPGSGVRKEAPAAVSYKGDEVVRKAVLAFKPSPEFTEEARRNEVTGVVRLRVALAANGSVTNISVLRSLPYGLTENALEAARHILFFPAVKGGQAVSQYVTLEYNFHIY